MPTGFPFPDVEKLNRALALRNWTREMLAELTGLHHAVIGKALTGRPIAVESIEKISRVLLDNPPDTATSAFMREDIA